MANDIFWIRLNTITHDKASKYVYAIKVSHLRYSFNFSGPVRPVRPEQAQNQPLRQNLQFHTKFMPYLQIRLPSFSQLYTTLPSTKII